MNTASPVRCVLSDLETDHAIVARELGMWQRHRDPLWSTSANADKQVAEAARSKGWYLVSDSNRWSPLRNQRC